MLEKEDFFWNFSQLQAFTAQSSVMLTGKRME